MHRTLAEILEEERQSNSNVLAHVIGYSGQLPEAAKPQIRLLMYLRLSDYLADALHTLAPPPLPEGGLFGGLFGLGGPATLS
jgi:hypothetical protein